MSWKPVSGKPMKVLKILYQSSILNNVKYLYLDSIMLFGYLKLSGEQEKD